MFNRRDTYIALLENGAALGVAHVIGNSIDNRLTFQVNAFDLVAGIFGCGVESDGKVQSCVQSLSIQGEATFQCLLLCCIHRFIVTA